MQVAPRFASEPDSSASRRRAARRRARPLYWLACSLMALVQCSQGGYADFNKILCAWTRLVISPDPVAVATDGTVAVKAELYQGNTPCAADKLPNHADHDYSWSSADPQVFGVQGTGRQGTVTGRRGGTANVIIRYSGTSTSEATATVVVDPASLEVTPNPVDLQVGQEQVVTATARHSDQSPVTLPITWSINNPLIATLTPGAAGTATVRAVAPGITFLTATAGTKTAQAGVQIAGLVVPAFLEGYFMNHDGSRGVGGAIINLGVIPARPVTAADGFYRAEVTPGGNITVFTRGVCDLAHPLCDHELSLNESAVEMVQVAQGMTVRFDLSAQRGRHLRITGGAADLAVLPGAMFPLALDYHTWNNVECPGCAAWLVPGIDGTAGPVHLIGVAGPYTNQDPAKAIGKTNLMMTAPAAAGTYGVFVLRAAVSTGQEAVNLYTTNWPNPSLFIRVFTLKVCATAPNCP